MGPKRTRGGESHRFGGDWTTVKLDVIAAYLSSYTTALKDKPSKEKPFTRGYIDAFAGTGYRGSRQGNPAESKLSLPFPDLADDEAQAFLDGSARRALKTEPRFDRYVFIEQNSERCAQLERLKLEFPHFADDIQIHNAEANSIIQKLCSRDWRLHRAVLFLDPYGLQVEWTTIEAIARTQAIDLWVLFPLGIGVNRLLTRSGEIPESWRKRLDTLLGTSDWYEEFYRMETFTDLYGDAERVVKASVDTIGKYFNDRLRSVFCAVAENPKVLCNSARSPLYLLCFAAGNPKGAPIALKIANYLLNKSDD
jgi:three-Cys-motif partner protein